jgi:hypothetical protein
VCEEHKSLLVLGPPGVGKTHLLQHLVAQLRGGGRTCAIVSKTHTACRRACPKTGQTADHYCRRILHGTRTPQDVVWIDEAGQLGTELWAQFAKIHEKQMLLSADFEQYGPIADCFRSQEVPSGAFERSTLLWSLAGGNVLRLHRCRRSSAELFHYYSSLITGGLRFNTPIADLAAEARELFPCHFSGPPRWTLVLSHKRRVFVNSQVNLALKPVHALYVSAPKPTKGQLCAPQDMHLWPGLELLGCSRGANGKVRNLVLYSVLSCSAETVELQDTGGAVVRLTPAQVAQSCRLSHARTLASIQGWETEPGQTMRLLDSGHARFERKHLYVGISRCREPRDIHVL